MTRPGVRLAIVLAFALLSRTLVGSPPAFARAPQPSANQRIAGTWEGTLDVGGTKLRVVLHLVAAAGDALTASIDSPDQGAFDLKVAKASINDRALALEAPAINARYTGTLDAAEKAIAGSWTQNGMTLPLTFVRSDPQHTSPKAEPSDPIQPLWLGVLDAGPMKLRLAVHLTRGPDGTLHATVDSLDQGANGLPVSSATFKGGTLLLELRAIGARFEGRAGNGGTEIAGTWTQGGASLPLTLKPVDALPSMARPQEPKGPLPYAAEEVVYENAAAGVKLAGTLTFPRVGQRVPGVVLITGSGAENRDEAVFGHKPFLVLADHLTRKGIAVLRVDDRGVGGSSAGSPGATSEDFAGDVLAGVAYLRTRTEIDPTSIGLIGHSEGGIIASIAAARSREVAFVVMMAGPGLPGEEILHLQSAALLRAGGASADDITKARTVNAKIYEIVKAEKDPVALESRVRASLEESGLAAEAARMQAKAITSPWFRYFLRFDPRTAIAGIKVPVLAIVGERDLQVPATENLAAIKAALDAARHPDHTERMLPGLNHLFQPATTGLPDEYARIETTIAPEALDVVSQWILARTRRGRTE